MKKTFLAFIVIASLLLAMFGFSPAFAAGSCTFNPQHGWHIVGGGSNNDHWYETEAECLVALTTPTETPDPTEEVTATPDPTEEVTVTPDPTEEVTATPDPTEETTETPEPTEQPKTIVAPPKFNGCQQAYDKIMTLKFKDEGYRYFDHHPWCYPWAILKYGTDVSWYRVNNP